MMHLNILKVLHVIWAAKAMVTNLNQDFSGRFCGIYVRKATGWGCHGDGGMEEWL
ncbi:TPA: hypothetical protein PBP97_002561 [Escherichia coli]|nr:hypothetical protein [Escherichia coli]